MSDLQWYRATRLALGSQALIARTLGIPLETLRAREYAKVELELEAELAMRYLSEHPELIVEAKTRSRVVWESLGYRTPLVRQRPMRVELGEWREFDAEEVEEAIEHIESLPAECRRIWIETLAGPNKWEFLYGDDRRHITRFELLLRGRRFRVRGMC